MTSRFSSCESYPPGPHAPEGGRYQDNHSGGSRRLRDGQFPRVANELGAVVAAKEHGPVAIGVVNHFREASRRGGGDRKLRPVVAVPLPRVAEDSSAECEPGLAPEQFRDPAFHIKGHGVAVSCRWAC